MGRPSKGIRLHKFSHRPNWYIREGGKPDKSAGTDCLGRAMNVLAFERKRSDPVSIGSDAEMVSAVRKVIRKSRERAKLKGLPFDLTEAAILQLIDRQGGRCALTGLDFSTDASTEGRRQPYAPSADRIDNALGYTISNIRIVCAIANLARGDFSDAEFIAMCKGVALHVTRNRETKERN